MTTIVITKDDRGKLVGLGEKDKKAYARFRKKLDKLEPGEILTLDHWFPRHGKFHRLHFVMINAIYDAQEQFFDVTRRSRTSSGQLGRSNSYGRTCQITRLPKWWKAFFASLRGINEQTDFGS